MCPTRFAIQLTYLENLAKLHQYYTTQRGEDNAPEELTSLLRTEIQILAMMPAENLCIFAELHRLILQRIVNTKNLELVRVDADEKAAKKASEKERACKSGRNRPHDYEEKDKGSDREDSYSGSEGE
ncbi:MAG: hypothetical protein Q9180_007926 [Flavoplaca navasiana]